MLKSCARGNSCNVHPSVGGRWEVADRPRSPDSLLGHVTIPAVCDFRSSSSCSIFTRPPLQLIRSASGNPFHKPLFPRPEGSLSIKHLHNGSQDIILVRFRYVLLRSTNLSILIRNKANADPMFIGVAVRLWQLGIEMRPFFNRGSLWGYPLFAAVGGVLDTGWRASLNSS